MTFWRKSFFFLFLSFLFSLFFSFFVHYICFRLEGGRELIVRTKDS